MKQKGYLTLTSKYRVPADERDPRALARIVQFHQTVVVKMARKEHPQTILREYFRNNQLLVHRARIGLRQSKTLIITVTRKLRGKTYTESAALEGRTRIETMRVCLRRIRNRVGADRLAQRNMEDTVQGISVAIGGGTFERVYRINGVHTEPLTIPRLYTLRKAGEVFRAKKPLNPASHVGIELEFYSRASRDEVAAAFFTAGLSKIVELKSDGSIRAPEGYYPHEVAILTTAREYVRDIPKVLDVINRLDSGVNSSCGLHVHLDMRKILRPNLPPDQCEPVKKVYGNLVVAHRLLVKMLPPSRQKNQYCRLNSSAQKFNQDRYSMVNADSLWRHRTIEVRSHSATLNATKIMNWVSILRHIANSEAMFRVPESVERLAARVKLPKRLTAYINERIANVNAETSPAQQAA
jgi:hypothetical protein